MSFESSRTEHFFFGPEERSLFGSYHAPSEHRAFGHAVVLCYPFGFEYIRAHRSFRQLAIRLANKGFGVLRFVFFGTGDSSGDFEGARLQHWIEDVGMAAEKLKSLSGARKICVIGLRLGASIAAIAAKGLPDIDPLVLWEPVVRGEDYLHEIAVEDKRFANPLGGTEFHYDPGPDDGYPTEIIGFPMPSGLFKDLSRLDLLSSPGCGNNVHLVSNTDLPEIQAYHRKLNNGNGRVTLDLIDDQKLWLEACYKALVPMRTLNGIINRIIERAG